MIGGGIPSAGGRNGVVVRVVIAAVDFMELPVMGGEDFSYYCNEVPSCFFALGIIPEGQDSMIGVHHPKFNFNDDAIATGVEMFCRLALRSG